MTDPGDITRLLHRWRDGDRDAESLLFELLLPDLRKIAARCMRGERTNHTLQKTALVNECFIKLVNLKHIDWRDRGHFLAIVTRKMRHVLIEYARKRGKYKVLQLEGLPEALLAGRNWMEIALTVDSLLDELEKESPTKCSVVVCRSYMGLTTKETAEMLGLTENSVEHEWHRARKWLYQRLSEAQCKTATSS